MTTEPTEPIPGATLAAAIEEGIAKVLPGILEQKRGPLLPSIWEQYLTTDAGKLQVEKIRSRLILVTLCATIEGLREDLRWVNFAVHQLEVHTGMPGLP